MLRDGNAHGPYERSASNIIGVDHTEFRAATKRDPGMGLSGSRLPTTAISTFRSAQIAADFFEQYHPTVPGIVQWDGTVRSFSDDRSQRYRGPLPRKKSRAHGWRDTCVQIRSQRRLRSVGCSVGSSVVVFGAVVGSSVASNVVAVVGASVVGVELLLQSCRLRELLRLDRLDEAPVELRLLRRDGLLLTRCYSSLFLLHVFCYTSLCFDRATGTAFFL